MVATNVKRLRTEMTDAEKKLWRALRSRSIGPKFRRQVPLGRYIIDFVCFESKVIVEVDGGQHADSRSDAVRDDYFAARGYRVLRFWNNDVLRNLEGVLTVIAQSHPSPGTPLRGVPPSPARGEGNRARGTAGAS
ncbi:MAG: endonuclease domain-containing protein [Alphaproteobacteria bacterium]|nr:endonuclease domain-containing protein [Alphaproteobacteria bacterium]